jgi:hypothetical protein
MIDSSIASAAAGSKGAPAAAVPAGVVCIRLDGIEGEYAWKWQG